MPRTHLLGGEFAFVVAGLYEVEGHSYVPNSHLPFRSFSFACLRLFSEHPPPVLGVYRNSPLSCHWDVCTMGL